MMGSDTAQYVHGPTGIQAMQDAAGDWRWTVQDALGSVRGELDASLAVQASRGFSPYGEEFGEQGSFTSPFAFTGEPLDQDGLTHLRARYYTSEMGRLLNQDPSWFEQNLYEYGGSNPSNNVDPLGLCATQPGIVAQDICHVLAQYGSLTLQLMCPDYLPPEMPYVPTLLEPDPDDIRSLTPEEINELFTDGQSRSDLDDLKRKCYNGDLSACDRLKYLCEGGNQEACQKLEEAWHGDCDPWTYVPLRQEQKRFCNTHRTCKELWGKDQCEEIKRRIHINEACVNAREAIMVKCYGGGDQRHWNEVQKVRRDRARCEKRFDYWCKDAVIE